MSDTTGGPAGGGNQEVLALGIDSSGIRDGGNQAKVTLDQLKRAAAEAAAALDAIARPSGQGGQAVRDTGRAAAETAQHMARLTELTGSMAQAFGYAQRAALALGLAWGGMRLAGFVNEITQTAARIETLGAVINRVALNTNYSARQISEFTVGVQRMGITATAARTSIVQMIQAQMDLTQAARVARVAQDAAVVGNINSSEAFQRLVQGIQSGEVEILRTMGLNVNFQNSYERLAASLNKPAAALSELEKTQARTNAALDAGRQIAGAYAASMDTAGKQLLSLQRYTEDAAGMLGGALLPAFTSLIRQVTQGMQAFNNALREDTLRGSAGWIGSIGESLRQVADSAGAAINALAIGFGVTLVAALARFAASLTAVRAVLTGVFAAGATTPWVLALGAAAAALTFFGTRQGDVTRGARLFSETLRDQERAAGAASKATDQLTEAEKRLADFQAREGVRRAERNLVQHRQALTDVLNSMGFADQDRAQRTIQRGPDISAAPQPDDPIEMQLRRLAQMRLEFQRSDRGDAALARFVEQFDRLNAAVPAGSEKWEFFSGKIRDALAAVRDGQQAIRGLERALGDMNTQLESAGFQRFNLLEAQTNAARVLGQLGLGLTPGGQFGAADAIRNQDIGATMQGYRASLEQARQRVADEMDRMRDRGVDPNAQSMVDMLNQGLEISRALDTIIRAWPDVMRRAAEAMEAPFQRMERQQRDAMAIAGARTPQQRAAIQAQQQYEQFARDTPDLTGNIRRFFGLGDTVEPSADQADQFRRYMTGLFQAPANIQRQTEMQASAADAQVQARYAFQMAAAQADGAEAVRRVRTEMQAALDAQRGATNAAEALARAWGDIASQIGEAVANLRQMVQEQELSTAIIRAQAGGDFGAAGMAERAQIEARIRRQLGLSTGAPQLPGMPGAPSFGTAGLPQAPVVPQSSIVIPPSPAISGWANDFASVERAYGIPSGTLARIAYRESSGNPDAVNPRSGAAGLMGILPSTARDPGYGVQPIADVHDAVESIRFAGQYLGALIQRQGFDRAVTQYSGGEYTAAQLMGRTITAPGVAGGGSPFAPGAAMPREWEDYLSGMARRLAATEQGGRIEARVSEQVVAGRDTVAQSRADLETMFMSNTQREHALQLRRLEVEETRNLALVQDDQQRRQIAGYYEILRSQEAELDQLRRLQEQAAIWQEASSSAAAALGDGLMRVIVMGEDARQVLSGVTRELAQIAWRAAVTRPLENMLTGFVGNMFLGAAGAAMGGGLVDAGTWDVLARGGVAAGGFSGRSNSFVNTPTGFDYMGGGPGRTPFARGSAGLMGEAGPEAILPLLRDEQGNLGVRVADTGGGAGAAPMVFNNNITIEAGAAKGGQLDPAAARQLQMEIDRTVRMAVRQVVNDEQRPGGDLHR
ncbi:MAG: transglycosylase SLT domain-containing protein [Acetobacteraceae bacterium]